ncbi:MAG: GNAT family N-acetyltransferase [Vicinamibacteria bacterium]
MRIREADSTADLQETALIQREVWNVEDIEIVGHLQLKAAMHAGGSVLVAEMEDGAIAGFSYALPAYVAGDVFWHSDMLAVRPAFRGGQVGQKLKWAQRDHALRCGIKRITWTFDPMQAGNAHLNIELLGATACEYLYDFYGVTTSSLHHGLPTDRLLANWDLLAPAVQARADGPSLPPFEAEQDVAIPSKWNDLVAAGPAQAIAEQKRVAVALVAAFARGLSIQRFDKSSSSYLLGRPEHP